MLYSHSQCKHKIHGEGSTFVALPAVHWGFILTAKFPDLNRNSVEQLTL